jgi:hypothetical protein
MSTQSGLPSEGARRHRSRGKSAERAVKKGIARAKKIDVVSLEAIIGTIYPRPSTSLACRLTASNATGVRQCGVKLMSLQRGDETSFPKAARRGVKA